MKFLRVKITEVFRKIEANLIFKSAESVLIRKEWPRVADVLSIYLCGICIVQ